MQHHEPEQPFTRYIDLNQVAARFQVSRRQAEIMLARGDIPKSVRIGKLRR